MSDQELELREKSPEEFIIEDGTDTDAWKYNYRDSIPDSIPGFRPRGPWPGCSHCSWAHQELFGHTIEWREAGETKRTRVSQCSLQKHQNRAVHSVKGRLIQLRQYCCMETGQSRWRSKIPTVTFWSSEGFWFSPPTGWISNCHKRIDPWAMICSANASRPMKIWWYGCRQRWHSRLSWTTPILTRRHICPIWAFTLASCANCWSSLRSLIPKLKCSLFCLFWSSELTFTLGYSRLSWPTICPSCGKSLPSIACSDAA